MRTCKGSKALRVALTQSGHSAGKTLTYLGAVYHYLAERRGKKREALATERHFLIAVYAILCAPDDMVYPELGLNYFDEQDPDAAVWREVRRLEALGYQVTVNPVTSEAS